MCKNKLLFLLIYFISTQVYSQGSWDIKYISFTPSLKRLVKNEIRIDFKSSPNDKLPEKYTIRSLLYKKDTIEIKINNHYVKFVGHWKIYPDQGVIREQSLISLEEYNGFYIRIKEIFVQSFDKHTLTVEMNLYHSRKNKENKEIINFYVKEIVTIERYEIKGLLCRLK